MGRNLIFDKKYKGPKCNPLADDDYNSGLFAKELYFNRHESDSKLTLLIKRLKATWRFFLRGF